MRFPLRLTAALYLERLRRGTATTPILCFAPLVNDFGRILHPEQVTPGLEWHPPEACVAAADRAKARIVWLGDTEPLLHPNIGKVVAALLQSGRYVFVHTCGVDLRKRIHEFQPHSRLFLTVEVPNNESSTQSLTRKRTTSRAFFDAIEGARLSGFYRCAHVTVDAQTDAPQAARCFEFLNANGLEGFVVSSGTSPAGAAGPPTVGKLADIRAAIPSRGWRTFSRILEQSRHPLRQPRLAALRPSNREPLPLPPCETLCEENALTQ
jgi:Radical SAM superfamily